ncbi:hypothetical protein VNO77_07868 [Canavalia gladiata]|uniref:NB-ARC domain-containing protein n=1 Tax=Canavalia gladiata TaxID=3824 RepID=A0AAN9M9I1_CANGL
MRQLSLNSVFFVQSQLFPRLDLQNWLSGFSFESKLSFRIFDMFPPVTEDVPIRHQTGEFGNAFENLVSMVSMEEGIGEAMSTIREAISSNWRGLLRDAASISGFVVLNSRNESEVIENIAENVTRLLDKTDLFVTDNPVGVQSRVQDMIQLLDLKLSNDVILIGMWGMGGIGKTTIAKAIYNEIGRDFGDRSFLANIREVWGQDAGQVSLQKQLLFDICKETKTMIHNIESGKNILMERLCHKSILLVLDDVNEMDQLNAFCGSRKWFGAGSRIIITTRDKRILMGNRGTKAVEGLVLKLPSTNTKCLKTKAFKKMRRLRLLHLAGVELVGDFEYLSKDLRWLCWHGFPLTCIPTNFYQGNLVSMEIEYSNIKHVWQEAQLMEKLKILNLSHSRCLMQTPDFSNLPNLEKLILVDCPRLFEVSHTIGHLNKILLINLKNCVNLRTLPRSIYQLKSLKALILSGCLMIDKLEEDLEQMESLITLIADKTAITRMPFSIVRSKSIGYISLCGYEGFSRDVFPSLIWSWMSPKNNFSSLVEASTSTSTLVSLNVPKSNSYNLLSISKDLPKLQSLWVECDSELQLSRHVSSILAALYASNCEELESTATTSQVPNMITSTLFECRSQMHFSESKNSSKSLLIQMGMNCQVTDFLRDNILQNMTIWHDDGCLLPGDNYPSWLTFNCEDSSVIFEVPQVNGHNLKTIMCIVHYSAPDNITSDGLKNVMVINYTKTTIQLYKRDALASFEDEEWQRVVSNIEPGNKVEVVLVFGSRFIVQKTTIYLIYDEAIDEKTGHCPAPDKNVIFSGDQSICTVECIFPQVESMGDFKQKQKRRKFE